MFILKWAFTWSLTLCEKLRNLLVEVYKKGGEIFHFGLSKGTKSKQMHFIAVKKLRNCSGFVIYSNLKDSVFTAFKRDAKF